jgi:hypothetical protein
MRPKLELTSGCYGDDMLSGRACKKMCKSCAFSTDASTVRPAGLTIAQLEEDALDYDDFICHSPNSEGTHDTCRGWIALMKREGYTQTLAGRLLSDIPGA